jgi:hypothetical protein
MRSVSYAKMIPFIRYLYKSVKVNEAKVLSL